METETCHGRPRSGRLNGISLLNREDNKGTLLQLEPDMPVRLNWIIRHLTIDIYGRLR